MKVRYQDRDDVAGDLSSPVGAQEAMGESGVSMMPIGYPVGIQPTGSPMVKPPPVMGAPEAALPSAITARFAPMDMKGGYRGEPSKIPEAERRILKQRYGGGEGRGGLQQELAKQEPLAEKKQKEEKAKKKKGVKAVTVTPPQVAAAAARPATRLGRY